MTQSAETNPPQTVPPRAQNEAATAPTGATLTPASAALTPAMKQYQQFKSQYPEYVLFFRMGDFYEMFWDDARLASRVLGVTLTSRSRGGLDAEDAIPMAGVPFHAVEGYLRRMIAAGHKVAICEQVEDPSQAKGVIRREVVRLMTPGTLTDDPLLDGRSENYLASVAFGLSRRDGYRVGLAWVELSTGACLAMSGNESAVLDEIARLKPAEILIPEHASGQPHEIGKSIEKLGITAITVRPGWQFTAHHAREEIKRQWQLTATAGVGFEEDDPALLSIGSVLTYLTETQKNSLAHLRLPKRHIVEAHLSIDPSTYRALEIDRTVRSGSAEGSLLNAIDLTRSAMGARMLRAWLRYPLRDLEHIQARQNAVAALLESPAVLASVVERLADVCDIERIVGRVTVGRASPRDLSALGKCLKSLPKFIDALESLSDSSRVAPELSGSRDFCQTQASRLESAIQPDPAPHLREGGIIAPGFDPELDRLRNIGVNSQEWLGQFQARLAHESGITSLKVGYNKVFGYYIEVTDSHRDKVPVAWTRKQTVKNAERYITSELKEFETEALGARDKAIALEQQIFEQVRLSLLPHVSALQELAAAIARVDVLCAFASLAQQRRYCRPTVVESRILEIIDGKHPVLEQQLASEFVANDARFGEADSLLLITGPNMAGKSTYIRQVALITLLAQIGSYVPAKSATIGLVDRLFARIGASDELHAGQSTFMVEMVETANILNNATDRSLVTLDEIGRGTSTLDGLSLAWAIAEHIAADVKCRTMFATHYHELTDLADRFKGVRNLNVAVREWEDQVIFLHRIIEGGTDRSYGIHVARLAGVPASVLERARQLLGELAVQHVGRPRVSRARKSDRVVDESQLPLFIDPAQQFLNALKDVKLDAITPMQAFELLRQWKAKFAK
jgi:DNA mismatch repair protein MutS